MRVIVTGYLATYPLGGLAWHYLNYLLGLRSMGHDVFYLEDTGNWMYDPDTQTFTDRIDNNVAAVQKLLNRFGFADRWAIRAPDAIIHGMSEAAFVEILRTTDVFLNVSGSCWLRDEYREIPRKAYIDTDPGYNQIRAHRAVNGCDDKDLIYSVERMAAHDVHYTFGLNAGPADCRMPSTPFEWIPTRQPIALDYWPVQPVASNAPYTTLMSWNAYAKPVEFDGRSYAGKEARLRKVIELPRRVSGAQFTLAISGQAPNDELHAAGWQLTDAHRAAPDAHGFQQFIASSRGEFSVAKDLYVDMRTGWFGDRSAAYLATGRPVIIEETGFSSHLPTGSGLLAFTNLTEAAEAVMAVEQDYSRHCHAARNLAEQYFAAPKILAPLLGVAT